MTEKDIINGVEWLKYKTNTYVAFSILWILTEGQNVSSIIIFRSEILIRN